MRHLAAVFGVQTIHSEPSESPTGDPSHAYRINLQIIDVKDSKATPAQLTFGDRLRLTGGATHKPSVSAAPFQLLNSICHVEVSSSKAAFSILLLRH